LAAVVEILHQCESPAAVFKVRYCLNLTWLEIYSCCSVAFQPREWPHKSNWSGCGLQGRGSLAQSHSSQSRSAGRHIERQDLMWPKVSNWPSIRLHQMCKTASTPFQPTQGKSKQYSTTLYNN
jgi:hypothetical protein